ncbi:hypothetical protein [Rahnella variigena]|jgi:hypothetical protein|uniref:Uncharacterized protein n=1 Tax=Rahnella variigena TaxID=574964 RepID=A0ABX9PPL9_9GAMM|nr:hypothetical protein [Rahnella variigena]RJT53615.1 hypothetical protein D6D38_11360 [Rahnella variigena]RKF66309.1 hypothetical protein CKQ54_23215 [Rahnella variigena]
MKAIDYIDALERRNVSFRLVQALLKEYQLTSARGWDLLRDVYVNSQDKQVLSDWKEIYESQFHYGKRTIFLSKLTNTKLSDKIFNFLSTSVDLTEKNTNKYLKKFPLPLPENELNKMSLLRPSAVDVEINNDIVSLVFTYPRVFKERDVIDFGTMSTTTIKDLDQFDEVIGVKNRYVQFFDKIIYDKKNFTFRFEIDNCSTITLEEALKAEERYRIFIIKGIMKKHNDVVAISRLNLFNKINKLYNDSDGNIVNLGHSTGTGSDKSEKMRKKTNDLRNESFHIAGLKALNGITNNYAISKSWKGELNTDLVLTIPGTTSLTTSSNPSIDHVIIDGCGTKRDFTMLLSKVI